MSRQPIRQLPPADDLQPTTDEEARKLAEAEVGKKQAPVASQAAKSAHTEAAVPGGPHAPDRSAYFSGQYSPVGPAGPARPEMTVDRRLAEFGVPDSLRHCVLDLVRVLREHGLAAALAALHADPALDRRFENPVRSLLTAIDRDDRRTRA
jgi:hypothetical protein